MLKKTRQINYLRREKKRLEVSKEERDSLEKMKDSLLVERGKLLHKIENLEEKYKVAKEKLKNIVLERDKSIMKDNVRISDSSSIGVYNSNSFRANIELLGVEVKSILEYVEKRDRFNSTFILLKIHNVTVSGKLIHVIDSVYNGMRLYSTGDALGGIKTNVFRFYVQCEDDMDLKNSMIELEFELKLVERDYRDASNLENIPIYTLVDKIHGTFCTHESRPNEKRLCTK